MRTIISTSLLASPLSKKCLANPPLIEERYKLEKKDLPEAPTYDYPKEYCAAYATRVARDKFGKKFIYSNAWDMRYNNKRIMEIKNNSQINKAIKKGVLLPGMIVGIYYPQSKYLRKKDKTGNPVKYTHLAVYVGIDKNGKPTFYHQFKEKIQKITLEGIESIGTIKEILDEKTP